MPQSTTNPWDTQREPSAWQRLTRAGSSLKCKATGLMVILILAVSASVSGYLLRSTGELARNQHDTHMISVAAMLSKAAGPIMVERDLDALRALAKTSANGAPLLYVIFSDEKGNQIAISEHGNSSVLRKLGQDDPQSVPVPGRPQLHRGDRKIPVFIDVTYPIVTALAESDPGEKYPATELLGYVRAGMVANHWQYTMSTKLDMVVGVGILAMAAAIPLGFLLVRRIILPLESLGHVMVRFSQGDLNARSTLLRNDEIGSLEAAFNRMADQHQHTHERIIRLNVELERRVAQRTQQLRELASREPLTGLYNRRYFNETLERRFSEALRYNADLSCIMIDMDGFKAVNDEYGHQVGDELLQLAAGTVASQLRTADVAARFGGDEFVALLPQTDAESARVLAERILEKFAQDIAERHPKLQTTMSIGIASLASLEENTPQALIRKADSLLYLAKEGGRNQIAMAEESTNPTAI